MVPSFTANGYLGRCTSHTHVKVKMCVHDKQFASKKEEKEEISATGKIKKQKNNRLRYHTTATKR